MALPGIRRDIDAFRANEADVSDSEEAEGGLQVVFLMVQSPPRAYPQRRSAVSPPDNLACSAHAFLAYSLMMSFPRFSPAYSIAMDAGAASMPSRTSSR